MLPGVYQAKKKSGQIYYRASITYNNKHISLGSYDTQSLAHKSYLEANAILRNKEYRLRDYTPDFTLPFDKWVTLHNYRDNTIYIKNPIYLYPRYFIYFLDDNTELTFDVDDLFFYSTHKIMRRDGYFFVNDYGMQINIKTRYGIKNFAVLGRDYHFIDGNPYNLRYDNIKIINRYNGVQKKEFKKLPIYTVKIHVNGDFVVGHYKSEDVAAIAFNKAVDALKERGVSINSLKNYIEHLTKEKYKELYNKIHISNNIVHYKPNKL